MSGFRTIFKKSGWGLPLLLLGSVLALAQIPPGNQPPSAEGGVEGSFTPFAETEKPAASATKGLETRISLDLRNIDVTEALRFLALKGGLNLAIGKAVTGRLMLLLNDVPLKDVLDIILLTNGLAYDKQGEIYNIMTEAEYKERYGRKFSDARKVKIFQLKYAIPTQVFSAIDALKSEVGRVLVDQESGMALVVDTEQSLAKIEEAVNTLESKRTIQVFPLKYATAKDVEERLRGQLDTKNAGTVTADARSNQVVIQTLPDRMQAIAHLIESLDRKTKEVLIISKIVKVTLSDEYASEIKWEGFFRQVNALGLNNQEEFIGNHVFEALDRTGESFSDDFVSIAPTARPTAGSKHSFLENVVVGTTGEDNFEVLIKYLKTLGDTKVLANPKLLIVNNQEAKIHVGERQVYVTTTTTTGQTTSTVSEQVNFVDVGIQLAVTPTINDDGYITMKVKPEISSVTGTLVTPTGNRIPIIDTSEAETTVMVKDGTSVIIAGLRRDDKTKTDKQVPYLADMPVLGRLFQSFNDKKLRAELLVILTPHIVEGDELVAGEPGGAEAAMKGYHDYNDFPTETEKKEKRSGGFSLKKIFSKR